jgi:hypothetical protein
VRSRTPRTPVGRPSVGPAVLLMALGGIIAFGGISPPAEAEKYVDVHRPRRARRRSAYVDRTDEWSANDVHRPGYADRTDALPTVRGDRRR